MSTIGCWKAEMEQEGYREYACELQICWKRILEEFPK